METDDTVVSMTKRCSKCRAEKPLTEFYSRSDHPSARPDCKECVRARATEYRDSNREKVRRSWRSTVYRKKFGITVEHYDRLYAEQGGACAICSTHQSELSRALAVDHDHGTGEVRGLLCMFCNHGLGRFKDSTELMGTAIRYLLRFEAGKDRETPKMAG